MDAEPGRPLSHAAKVKQNRGIQAAGRQQMVIAGVFGSFGFMALAASAYAAWCFSSPLTERSPFYGPHAVSPTFGSPMKSQMSPPVPRTSGIGR
jgi:hypothetical protein